MTYNSNIEAASTGQSDQELIPDYLIKETINGIPFYYKGFRQVMDKMKNKADIMADSGLQGFIKSYIFTLLIRHLDLNKYHVFVGETGAHLSHRNNLSLDLCVYNRSVLTPDKITTKYIDVHPKIVVEIDVKVEPAQPGANTFDEFVLQKIRTLHEFGTEKLIWIFSKSKTVIVATPDNKWDVVDWNTDVELLEGITFNIATHLETMGINPDS